MICTSSTHFYPCSPRVWHGMCSCSVSSCSLSVSLRISSPGMLLRLNMMTVDQLSHQHPLTTTLIVPYQISQTVVIILTSLLLSCYGISSLSSCDRDDGFYKKIWLFEFVVELNVFTLPHSNVDHKQVIAE